MSTHQHVNFKQNFGAPHPISSIQTGNCGCPKVAIDQEWLLWATQHRSTTHIAQFLGVSVPTVSKAMIEYGIWPPMEQPIIHSVSPSDPTTVTYTQINSYTVAVSQWSKEELDHEIMLLHVHFPNAGVKMLHGHFHQMGENVPHEHICQALNRISPGSNFFANHQSNTDDTKSQGPITCGIMMASMVIICYYLDELSC